MLQNIRPKIKSVEQVLVVDDDYGYTSLYDSSINYVKKVNMTRVFDD